MKRIRLICHEPMAIHPNYKQGWADVWIYYKIRPGRRKRFGPTLVCKSDLEADLIMDKQCQRENPDLDFSEEILEDERIIEALKHAPIVVGKEYGNGCPSIFTAADGIDRAEAERMLSVFLARQGVNYPKFVWKRPKMVVMPISFNLEALQAAKMEDA